MVRGFLMLAAFSALLLSASGCGIKARTYVAERERVDQGVTGNAGYIAGQGSSMAGRPTRKVYVLEIEREKKEAVKPQAAAVQPTAAAQEPQPAPEAAAAAPAEAPSAAVVPPVQEEAPASAVTTADGKITQYTVQKDDTLQKIAKKVYNSYGKWTKIYEANKDKIKNPNFVKQGTVLTIPQD